MIFIFFIILLLNPFEGASEPLRSKEKEKENEKKKKKEKKLFCQACLTSWCFESSIHTLQITMLIYLNAQQINQSNTKRNDQRKQDKTAETYYYNQHNQTKVYCLMMPITMPIQHLISRMNRIGIHPKTCCFGSCINPPIFSHTISENQLYKLHPDLQQLLTFDPDINSLLKHPQTIQLIKIIADKFSTFPGFCNDCDTKLFRLIDNYGGAINNEIATLIHYRVISYGIHHIKMQLRAERLVSSQQFQGNTDNPNIKIGHRKLKKGAFTRRLNYCLNAHEIRKKMLEDAICQNKFESINFIATPGSLDNPIFCGRSSILLHENDGFFREDGYTFMPWITYMTLRTNSTNCLVFCWLKQDGSRIDGLTNLINTGNFKEVIAKLAYGYSDAMAIKADHYNKHAASIDYIIKNCRTY